jgi:hypothetical protein
MNDAAPSSGALAFDTEGAPRVRFGAGTEGLARLRDADAEDAIVGACTYVEADIRDAVQVYSRRRMRRLPVIMSLGLLLAVLGTGGVAPGLTAFLVFYFVFLGSLMARAPAWHARRLVRTEPAFQGEHRWRFSEEGVHMHSAHADLWLRWPAVLKVWETRDAFLLFPLRQNFHIVPKRALPPEDVERLRALFGAHTQLEAR